MPLLADYALTPDVFDMTSYSSEEVCGLHLQMIREVLMTEGLVRDLRHGAWRGLFANDGRPWHRRGKELVKKMASQGRLVQHESVAAATPADDREWCAEALGTHARETIAGGVIVTEPVKSAFPEEPLVAQIDRLSNTSWWTGRSPSVRLLQSLRDYQQHLHPILRCSNSLQFVDPHLDPSRRPYREFGDLEVRFRRALANPLTAAGLRAEVFVWADFHDRYLISNLIGISLPNGFDTTADPRSITTWTRLGRAERDDVQREFEEPSRRHTLRHRFTI